MLLGHNIYVFYGSRHSRLGAKGDHKLLSVIGISVSLLLLTLTLFHQTSIGWDEDIRFTLVLLFLSLIHIVLYGVRYFKKK
jgi:hypothetical protein